MLVAAGAIVLLSSSLLPQSRLLRLRGGSAVPAMASPVTSQEAQPQGPLRLQLVAGSDTAVVRVPRVELSSANVAALQLQPGTRVRIARAHKRTDKPAWRPTNPFQKPIPEATLAELREAEAPTPLQPYVLGDGEARLPSKAMQAMRLQAGDTVLVAPLGPAHDSARPVAHRRSGWSDWSGWSGADPAPQERRLLEQRHHVQLHDGRRLRRRLWPATLLVRLPRQELPRRPGVRRAEFVRRPSPLLGRALGSWGSRGA